FRQGPRTSASTPSSRGCTWTAGSWREGRVSSKPINQKAWWLVLPVVLLVGFNAIVPLMAVVNYSVQETFGNNRFFFEGVKWFDAVLHSARFHDALKRQILFTAIILAIEVPLGV